MRIRPKKKTLYFSTTFQFHIKGSAFSILPSFERAFEPSSYIRARLRALVLFLFERAFEPSTIKGSAFRTLPPFECAFEPLTIKGSAFPTLPPFECAFEPSTIKDSVFPTLPPFECALEPSFPSSFHLLNSGPSSPIMSSFEKSSYFSTGQVTHYNVTILKNHRIFQLGR